MMNGLKIYNFKSVDNLINRREGETKFGEKVQFIANIENLSETKAKYVLFGIPEDIGVRANYGKPGAAKAWEVCLKNLLNIQATQYTNPEKLVLLGEIDCVWLMEKAANYDVSDPNYTQKLGDLVKVLDDLVSEVVFKIITAGKIPIIIGGGHNNAFGNIKGSSLALKKPINILNIDAHTDLRKTDYRHSGNGFSYARKDQFLGKYSIFGLHQNYTPDYIFKYIDKTQNINFQFFDDLLLKSSNEVIEAFCKELDFIAQDDFGLELDCDSIANFPSSAQTPSGFSLNLVRNFIEKTSVKENIKYLHLCEAAPTSKNETMVGKTFSYLIVDFIKM